MEYFKEEAPCRGYRTVANEKYTALSRDFSPTTMAAKNADAEVILSSPLAPDGLPIMRQRKELDCNPKALVAIRTAEDLSWELGKGL